MLHDQYAFRPTGLTTAALIDLLQQITNLLQHNEFVVMFTVDLTKAFDSVKHMPLMQKMELLQLPDHIYNWLVHYFEARGHSTRLGNIISTVAAINASIVQGSVVGPPSYVIVASDLRQRHSENRMMKYADDTYVLVGSSMIHTVTEEFENIQTWAAKNNLKIHPNKTKEMLIFRRRTSRAKYSSEPIIPGAERVDALRVLGVTLNSRLAMGDHIDRIIATCASTRFALRTLKSHGLRPLELHLVARMTSVASLMYASPAWWGFTDAAERTPLNRQLASLRRAGYLPVDFPSFEELARLVCSSQFPPTWTMFSGIILKTKTLLDIICAPVVITLLFLIKTFAILYPGYFMQLYFSAIICLFFAPLFNYISCYVIILDFFCKSQLCL